MILTLKELADYLRVNERTILRMLKSGQIEGAKIGGQWRFNTSQIDQMFFRQGEQTAEESVPLEEITRQPVSRPVSRILTESRVIPQIESSEVPDVLTELAGPLIQEGVLMEGQAFIERLEGREQLLSTGVGGGIAIPHPREPETSLREPAVIVLGRSSEGIEFNALDGAPVHLFFLVCCQNIEIHLRLMGRIARLAQYEGLVERCREATDGTDLFRVILEAEQRQLFGGA